VMLVFVKARRSSPDLLTEIPHPRRRREGR
jgi:hypothetical protein